MQKRLIPLLIAMSLFTVLQAKTYEGKYKYFKKQEHFYESKIPKEVSSTNFGYIGNYVDNDYIIRFKTDGGSIRTNLEKKIRLLRKKIVTNKNAISELKYNKFFTYAEIQEEKRVYIKSNNIWRQKIKDYSGALILLDREKINYGIKYTGYILDIGPKRGSMLLKGFYIFTTMDTSIARMKIKVTKDDFDNIENLRIKRNNTIIEKKFIKSRNEDGVDYLYIYLNKPSEYEIEKIYNITIF